MTHDEATQAAEVVHVETYPLGCPSGCEACLRRVAFVQNGRAVGWSEVTTEDLRADLTLYPTDRSTRFSAEEWERRMGTPFDRGAS